MSGTDMTSRNIAVLPETLKNQIAAGEVVERPSSVVKELVENSLDAGADRVDVVIERGGQGFISVQDNGTGIRPDQLELAVTRHATSKIESVRDLFAVRSFGFRGEALASTASVSRLRIASRAQGADDAAFIAVEKGEVVEHGPDALVRGTRVDIRDLFLGVPARLKFLKTEATEARKCREVVFRQALAHLEVGFNFESNGKKMFQLACGESLSVRLGHFWPPAMCAELRDFAFESEGRRVYGLAGAPSTAQSRADRMLFYVNGRPVQNRMLMSAAREAYKGRLLSKESPQLVLFLDVPLREVDVNVHPAKTEVRFMDEKFVFSLVRRGIMQALAADTLEPCVHDAPGMPFSAPTESAQRPAARPGNLFSDSAKYPSYGEYRAECRAEHRSETDGIAPQEPVSFRQSAESEARIGNFRPSSSVEYHEGSEGGPASYAAEPSAARIPDIADASSVHAVVPGLSYLGQVAGTYLVLKFGDDTLGLLDQHAAHERVLFEKMRRDKSRGDAHPLTVPLDFALHGSEAERLEEMRTALEAMGFRTGRMHESGCEITAVPPSLEPGRALEYLRGAVSDRSKGVEDLWIMLSCRAAIKGGDVLAPDEALALIREWLGVPDKEYCPHGRPAVLRFSGGDLEKMFKRRG